MKWIAALIIFSTCTTFADLRKGSVYISKEYAEHYDPYYEDRPGPEVSKGALVRIHSWSEKKQVFFVKLPHENAIAPLPTLPATIGKNFYGVSHKQLMDNPDQFIGKEFYVSDKLPTLGINALKNRNQKSAKANKRSKKYKWTRTPAKKKKKIKLVPDY